MDVNVLMKWLKANLKIEIKHKDGELGQTDVVPAVEVSLYLVNPFTKTKELIDSSSCDLFTN